uniref:hypothetical protein n=1 Tax=Aliarcobacter sp. TaxID=2321116 RepID=UPI004047D3EF
MNNNKNIETYKKDFKKFVEYIGKDNNIPIPNTQYHHKLFDWLDDKRKEINNSLAINETFLGKEKSSRCFDDGIYKADMILHLRKTRENGKISIECIKERTPKISSMILDDPIKES